MSQGIPALQMTHNDHDLDGYSPNVPVALPPIPEAALPALDVTPPAPAIPAAGPERCPKPGEPNVPDITRPFVSAPNTSGATKFNGPERIVSVEEGSAPCSINGETRACEKMTNGSYGVAEAEYKRRFEQSSVSQA